MPILVIFLIYICYAVVDCIGWDGVKLGGLVLFGIFLVGGIILVLSKNEPVYQGDSDDPVVVRGVCRGDCATHD